MREGISNEENSISETSYQSFHALPLSVVCQAYHGMPGSGQLHSHIMWIGLPLRLCANSKGWRVNGSKLTWIIDKR